MVSLECGLCHKPGKAIDGASTSFIWCRDCGRTLCHSCASGPKHGGGHRWAAWQDWDVLKSTALGFEARLDRRARLAEREEKALKAFLSDVQERLLRRLKQDQTRHDEADRRRVAALSRAMGDEAGLTLAMPPGGPPTLDVTLEDKELARMCKEAIKIEPNLEPALMTEPLSDSPIAPDSSFALLPASFTPRAFIRLLQETMRKEHWGNAVPETRKTQPRTARSFYRTEKSEPSARELSTGRLSRSTRALLWNTADTSPSALKDSPKPIPKLSSREGVQDHAIMTMSPCSPLTSTSTPTPSVAENNGAGSSAPVSFHFGSEYLTRPIDERALPGDRLAVSDSTAGVFILTRNGSLLHKISTNGASASSLSYSRGDGRLYVSLLTSKGTRLLRAYHADTYEFIEDLKAPTLPGIDNSRTRWIATSSQGDVYLVSGDGKRSAVWKLSALSDSWITVADVAGAHRFQYLQVVEEGCEKSEAYHVLLTVDGLSGGILLLVVDLKGRLLCDYNLARLQGFEAFLKSPASAVVDAEGNLLMVDYADGKLYVKIPRDDESSASEVRVRLIAELGPKGALGMTVSGGWVYLARPHHHFIQAIKYKPLPSRQERRDQDI